MYIEGILDRIYNDVLQDENNQFRIVLDGSLGEYLENYNNHVDDMFLSTATGKYLDMHGKDYNVFRNPNESDTDYRNRIIVDASLLESTTDFSKLDLNLWVYFDSVEDKNQLTSRNPYLKEFHDDDYIFIGSGSDVDYIKSKFLVGDIKWES